ncbi:hypothetical protein Tco_0400830 [Tanacetum coccineum]
MHILYAQSLTKEKVFEKDVSSNHVGNNKLKSIDGVGTERMKKKKKKDNDMPKEPNKEWKLNEKAVPCKENKVMEEDARR